MSAPLIYLIAGEASGDLLGSHLMRALKERSGNTIAFAGIGGVTMTAEGLTPLFPMADLAVMGIVEVLARLPRLLRRIDETVADILHRQPAVVVTIDSPDFCFRVAKRIRKTAPHVKLVHYVAPSVWAWRPKRAAKIARFLDHLLALLPFEPPYFEKEGLGCTFVGHPAVENPVAGDASRFRDRHAIAADMPIVCLLPGSRHGEISRMLPLFLDVAGALTRERGKIFFAVPTVPHLVSAVREILQGFDLPHAIVEGEKADAFAAGHVALAASGTVALELGLAGLPSVICYRASPLTAFIARRVIKLPHVSLINLILKREIMPEFMQEQATVPALTAALLQIWEDTPQRRMQLAAGADVGRLLKPEGLTPGQCAAAAVLEQLNP